MTIVTFAYVSRLYRGQFLEFPPDVTVSLVKLKTLFTATTLSPSLKNTHRIVTIRAREPEEHEKITHELKYLS